MKKLIEKHRALIDEVKEALKKELDPEVHDDLFILRYWCVDFFFFSFVRVSWLTLHRCSRISRVVWNTEQTIRT